MAISPFPAIVMGLGLEDEDHLVVGAGVMHSARSVGTSGGENEDQTTAGAGAMHSARSVGTSAGKIFFSPLEGSSSDKEIPTVSQLSRSAEEMGDFKGEAQSSLWQTPGRTGSGRERPCTFPLRQGFPGQAQQGYQY